MPFVSAPGPAAFPAAPGSVPVSATPALLAVARSSACACAEALAAGVAPIFAVEAGVSFALAVEPSLEREQHKLEVLQHRWR